MYMFILLFYTVIPYLLKTTKIQIRKSTATLLRVVPLLTNPSIIGLLGALLLLFRALPPLANLGFLSAAGADTLLKIKACQRFHDIKQKFLV